MKTVLMLAVYLTALGASFCARAAHRPSGSGGTANIGERFFLETRFSKYFYDHSGGNANYTPTNGDPVMDVTVTINGSLPGPYAGSGINCRACHLVEEHENVRNRTYADFAPRSPIPANGDGRTHAPRNSIDMVNSLLPHSTPLFLHYDGEFVTAQDLIISTFTGRNFGWKPSEYATAVSHIVHIIREDNASGGLAQQYGGWTYAEAFAGGLQIEPQYRIAPAYSLYNVAITNTADTNYVSDEQIIRGIAVVVQDYMETLVFATDLNGLFNGSPYDVFLMKNGLPRSPAVNETPIQYGRRLLQRISSLSNPQFVSDPADGHLVTHDQPFQFGPTELAGLKLFLTEGKSPSGAIQNPAGNCIACHAPPAFTDFLFHNTGAAQEEYDSIHGAGAFMNLSVPELSARQTNYDAYLPATTNHPNATGRFMTPPSVAQPGMVDLGLWNVFANPDKPAPQPALHQILPLLMPTPAPQIVEASRVGANFVFSGTNGIPGWTYNVFSSTNLQLPAGSWDIVSTNTFDSQGRFSVTNSILPNSRKFFMLAAAGPSDAQALPRTIALFKTPDLRDLTSSEPYLHTGRINTLQDMIVLYQSVAGTARAGLLRNAAPALSDIYLDASSIVPLVAFLRSLSEDYEDIPCPCP
jgi:hypothetical protein